MPFASFAVLFALYFSQGLPSGVLAHAVPAIMREQGVALEYIGLIKLLALPWALKFIWAPYVDRLGFKRLGVHRTWIIAMQSLLIAILLFASFASFENLLGPLMIVFLLGVLVINTAAATQDIATDGLAVKTLQSRWRGLGNSIQVTGYKVGMIISGSGLLLAIEMFGWNTSIQLLAFLLFLLLLPVLTRFFPLSVDSDQVVATARPGLSLPLVVYKGFFKQKNMLLWVLVLLTYKLSDSLGSVMIKPLLIDKGFSLGEVASLTLWSSISGLIGAALGGLLYLRIGAKRLMLLAGLLQAIGVGLFSLVSIDLVVKEGIYILSFFEQAVDGLSTVALFTLMMAQCRAEHEGADFTVQASMQVLISGLIAALGGFITSVLGYFSTFVLAGCLGIACLLPVLLYFRTND